MNERTVTIFGKITGKNPELRYTPSGKAVADLSVRVPGQKANERYGREARDAYFVNVTAWDKLAENVCESLQVGDEVIVQGRLETQTWNDKTTGEEKSKDVLTANKIGLDLTWRPVLVVRVERIEPQAPAGELKVF